MNEPHDGLSYNRYFHLLLLRGPYGDTLNRFWDCIGNTEQGRLTSVNGGASTLQARTWWTPIPFSAVERLEPVSAAASDGRLKFGYDLLGFEFRLPIDDITVRGIAAPFSQLAAHIVGLLREGGVLMDYDFLHARVKKVVGNLLAGEDAAGRAKLSRISSKITGDPDMRRIVFGGHDTLQSEVFRIVQSHIDRTSSLSLEAERCILAYTGDDGRVSLHSDNSGNFRFWMARGGYNAAVIPEIIQYLEKIEALHYSATAPSPRGGERNLEVDT